MEARSDSKFLPLFAGIHREPPLRDWVTLESKPLLPRLDVEAWTETGWRGRIKCLLATSHERGLHAWGLIEWEWPSCTVRSMMRIDDTSASAANPVLAASSLATTPRLEALCGVVERGQRPTIGPVLEQIYASVAGPAPPWPAFDHSREPEEDDGRPTIHRSGPKGPPRERGRTDASITLGLQDALKEADGVLRALGEPELLHAWMQIRARTNAPQFAVVVAGEFSRGKSTFLNNLLGRDLLPTGNLATTSVPTQIVGGAVDSARLIQSTGIAAELDVPDVRSINTQENTCDPGALLRVTLAEAWMRASAIMLIDTPGVEDPDSESATVTFRALRGADAAMVAISATLPLSLTERLFIEEQLLKTGTPRVVVVVTRLDEVAPDERLAVVRNLRARIVSWAPDALLWTSQEQLEGINDFGFDAVGPAAIRRALTAMARDPRHRALRVRQIRLQLAALLEQAESLLEVQRHALHKALHSKNDVAGLAFDQLELKSLGWTDLTLETQKRKQNLLGWLARELTSQTTDLENRILQDLCNTKDKRKYWNSTLPETVTRAFKKVSASIHNNVEACIAQDSKWLAVQVEESFEVRLSRAPSDLVLVVELGSESENKQEIADLGRKRNFVRFGIMGGIAAIGSVVAAPVALAASFVAFPLAERAFSELEREQFEGLKQPLNQLLAQICQDTLRGWSAQIEAAYAKVVSHTEQLAERWIVMRKRALEDLHEVTSVEETLEAVEAQIHNAAALRRNIQSMQEDEK